MEFGYQNKTGQYFSDTLDVMDIQPYKISKLTIYLTINGIIGIKANYFSFKTLSTIKG